MDGGSTPLFTACGNGHTEIASALLAAGAKVNQAGDWGYTPLSFACQEGHTETATALIAAGAKVNQARDDGVTPLFIACQEGHTETAAALIAAGAKVNQAMDGGSTPLYIACGKGHTETAAALLAAGAKVNQAGDWGYTPLYIACREGHTEIATALIAAGANVNQAAEDDGETPLFTACYYNRLSTVQLLSSYGASRTFPDGETAEEVAAEEGYDELHAWLVRSRQWTTPLHHLATVGADRARALLRGGADLRAAAAGADAPTPLSLAERLRADVGLSSATRHLPSLSPHFFLMPFISDSSYVFSYTSASLRFCTRLLPPMVSISRFLSAEENMPLASSPRQSSACFLATSGSASLPSTSKSGSK
jgi:ankyrin repeat protein